MCIRDSRYPVETVQMMARIAQAVESVVQLPGHLRHSSRPNFAQAIAAAARALAARLDMDLVVALTTTGRTARLLSQLRPTAPVLACTDDEHTARLLTLYWGVRPFVTTFPPHTEAMIRSLDHTLVSRGFARPGDSIVIVGSVPIVARGRTNFIQLHRLGRAARPR